MEIVDGAASLSRDRFGRGLSGQGFVAEPPHVAEPPTAVAKTLPARPLLQNPGGRPTCSWRG